MTYLVASCAFSWARLLQIGELVTVPNPCPLVNETLCLPRIPRVPLLSVTSSLALLHL